MEGGEGRGGERKGGMVSAVHLGGGAGSIGLAGGGGWGVSCVLIFQYGRRDSLRYTVQDRGSAKEYMMEEP